jgi:hypothetical protein
MKYLRTFSKFESMTIDIGDEPDVKKGKERYNQIELQLKEYKEKKSKLEQLYSMTKNALEVETELKKLMPDKKNINPFLTDYIRILRLQKEMEDSKKSTIDDKIKSDDLNQSKNMTTNASQSEKIDAKIKEINDRTNVNNQKIAKISQELKKLITDHKNKMTEIEKELKEYNKSLTKKF